jgi:hypothetical protein
MKKIIAKHNNWQKNIYLLGTLLLNWPSYTIIWYPISRQAGMFKRLILGEPQL